MNFFLRNGKPGTYPSRMVFIMRVPKTLEYASFSSPKACREANPIGEENPSDSALFRFWLRCSQGPRPYGHWFLDYACPKTKNDCCDTHSNLLDTLDESL